MYRIIRTTVLLMLITAVAGAAGSAFAQGVWYEGRVTGPAVQRDGRGHIEIDNVDFTFAPGADIYRRVHNISEDRFTENPVPPHGIRVGDEVTVRIQGHRIHQLVILP